ncbi:MAG TPA: PEGA domain-containing protein [Spirochaetia bacterium]|nr:PEGA domain-containing protein [Spirochaetia bacterium]
MKTRPAAVLLLCLFPLSSLRAQTTSSYGGSTSTAGAATTPATATPGATTTAPTSTSSAEPTEAKPDLSVPVDKKDKWVVGFCAFNAERLPAEDQYLTYSIPLILKNQLAGLSTHALPGPERDSIRKALVTDELEKVEEGVTALYKGRDALLLDSTGPNIPSTQAADDKIKAALARQAFLKTLDLSRIKVADEKPLEVKEGTGVGKLFDALTIPASVFCQRQGIDLLVGGLVREVEGYVLLDVWAYEATTGTVPISYTDAARKEEVYQSVPEAGRQLTGLLLGKPWATISFMPDPPEGSLYINGKLVATGRTPVLYVVPGKLDIRVAAPGYYDLVQTLTLNSDEDTSLMATLQKEKAGTIFISSTPAGADVYVESVWKGKTPLVMEKPFGRTRVDVTEEGFYDMPFSISDSSPSQVSVPLPPDTISRDAIQKKARDDFYDSFAWFVVSLPIPLFCYAFALDSSVQYNELIAQGNPSQARNTQVTTNLWYGGYLAGTVVSVSLFAWMVFRIIHYVSVSTRTAG